MFSANIRTISIISTYRIVHSDPERELKNQYEVGLNLPGKRTIENIGQGINKIDTVHRLTSFEDQKSQPLEVTQASRP